MFTRKKHNKDTIKRHLYSLREGSTVKRTLALDMGRLGFESKPAPH